MNPSRYADSLGPEVAVLRKSLTSTVVAITVCTGVLAIDAAVLLYGETVIATVVALVALVLLALFIRSQRAARLVIHERGIRLLSRRGEVLLPWTDIAELKPTFSTVSHPNTLIDLAITRRAGGRVVLRNNWVPRATFVQLITSLLSKERLT